MYPKSEEHLNIDLDVTVPVTSYCFCMMPEKSVLDSI